MQGCVKRTMYDHDLGMNEQAGNGIRRRHI